MIKKITIKFIVVFVVFCSISCSRVFDDDEDYSYNDSTEVFEDNALLYTKIFQFNKGNSFLWFDIRNEIANFSSPFFDHSFRDNIVNRYLRIDLRGRLYEYNSKKRELKILNYPLNIGVGKDVKADIVYSFEKKSPNICDAIPDKSKKRICERTYILSFKQIVFKDINFTLDVNIPNTYKGVTLTMYSMSQELYLIN